MYKRLKNLPVRPTILKRRHPHHHHDTTTTTNTNTTTTTTTSSMWTTITIIGEIITFAVVIFLTMYLLVIVRRISNCAVAAPALDRLDQFFAWVEAVPARIYAFWRPPR